MKTHSKRFTEAVTKLYTAFHNKTLNAGNPCACAVGSIVGNGEWRNNFKFCTWDLKPVFKNNSTSHKIYSGYTQHELVKVEEIFMISSGFFGAKKHDNFKGLCAVVEYLCELEGIPNIMDYTSLFETENDAPKRQLEEVFV